MGYIVQSDEVIKNVTKELGNMLDSPMTQFLQLGTPVLMDYFNCSTYNSTTTPGTDTIDEVLGNNSPIRYHMIKDLPVYGALKSFLVDLTDNDGLYDMNMEIDDLTLLPSTVVPTPYDHLVYRFKDGPNERVFVFRVNAIKKATVKSHYFEQFSAKLQDIDSYGDVNQLEKQTVKRFRAKLNNFGTNIKCILEEEQYKYSEKIDSIINQLVEEYTDIFYSKKYNSLIFRGELEQGYISYDPWLTHFCITNKILVPRSDKQSQIVLVNIDDDDEYKKKYNRTIYHALETRKMDRFTQMLFVPTGFSKTVSNPFAYYGVDPACKIDIYVEDEIKYPRNIYTDFPFITSIVKNADENMRYGITENLIIRFFKEGTLLNHINDSDIYSLENDIEMEHDTFTFRVIPMLIYVLSTLSEDIMRSYA